MTSEYNKLDGLRKDHKIEAGASEIHGFASGWIASGSDWRSSRRSFAESFGVTMRDDLDAFMIELSEKITEGLSDVDFGFQLLLPDDQVGLNSRRQALSDWCRGFLAGFGLTGRFQDAELSEEVQELLRDFGQIAQVEEELPEDDDNESDLTEISEYVRMGAIMCFTDCATKAVH